MYADAPLPSRGWTISSKMLYTEVLGTYAELPPAFLRVATKVELYSCCDEKFCQFLQLGRFLGAYLKNSRRALSLWEAWTNHIRNSGAMEISAGGDEV
jgi:hypothetical protein